MSKIKALVVDDSSFFRKRIKDILETHSDIEVVATASNGQEAVDYALENDLDVITMDYEMPVMNGVTATKLILAQKKVPILTFSSLSYDGARVTLDSLEAGAVDYLPKNFDTVNEGVETAEQLLIQKVLNLVSVANPKTKKDVSLNPEEDTAFKIKNLPEESKQNAKEGISKQPKLLLIGSSTGGPVALQKIIASLNPELSIPVMIIQHMPATFTKAFADRLNGLSDLTIKEAEHQDELKSGHIYIAPGGKQMLLDDDSKTISIIESKQDIKYKPSVDITFASAARHFNGQMMAVVLTGMGSDGREGAKHLKKKGATIWTEAEKSCVVYGMPKAVDDAGLSDGSYDIDEMKTFLSRIE